jgi:hypothetical protein
MNEIRYTVQSLARGTLVDTLVGETDRKTEYKKPILRVQGAENVYIHQNLLIDFLHHHETCSYESNMYAGN